MGEVHLVGFCEWLSASWTFLSSYLLWKILVPSLLPGLCWYTRADSIEHWQNLMGEGKQICCQRFSWKKKRAKQEVTLGFVCSELLKWSVFLCQFRYSNQKVIVVPLHSTGNHIQYPVTNPNGKLFIYIYIYIYIYITESFCCTKKLIRHYKLTILQ